MNETLLETVTRIWQNLGTAAISGARIIGIVLGLAGAEHLAPG